MSNQFFDHPVLNSPYVRPLRHWELDAEGQPTQKIIETRRRAEFITPIPKPKARKGSPAQQKMIFDEGRGLSDAKQEYDPNSIINELRQRVDQWRALAESRPMVGYPRDGAPAPTLAASQVQQCSISRFKRRLNMN